MAQEAEVSIRREAEEQRAISANSTGDLGTEGIENRGAKVLAVDGAFPKLVPPPNLCRLAS